MADLAEILKEVKSFQTDLNGRMDRQQQQIEMLRAEMLRPDGGGGGRRPQTKSIGEIFTESDQFKAFAGQQFKGRCVVVVPSNPLWETKIVSNDLGFPSAGGVPVQGIGIIPGAVRQLRVRDLLPTVPTTFGVVEFTKENVFGNSASPVAEGDDKNESTISFTPAQERIKTIAHWARISRQAAADVPGLMAYLNSRLTYGLDLKVEQQILAGDNVDEALNGIIPQSADYDTGLTVPGDTMVDQLRRAIFQVESSERGPCDGIVLHPLDWAKIELIKDEAVAANKGRYIVGDPTGRSVSVPTLWRRPVVESFSMDQGTFLVGGFATGAQVRNRMETVIDTSESHDSFYVKNLLAVRVECRLALVVTIPELFVNGSF